MPNADPVRHGGIQVFVGRDGMQIGLNFLVLVVVFTLGRKFNGSVPYCTLTFGMETSYRYGYPYRATRIPVHHLKAYKRPIAGQNKAESSVHCHHVHSMDDCSRVPIIQFVSNFTG